ncbi:hypothetical protein AGMMS49587_18860 [Spirochaetia bacterium]|nr:hypothetical protein AGMMS49587_18860 [Spirochaetia bacterium]
MKKLIALFIVLGLVVSTAFTQEIKFAVGGRAGFAPVVLVGGYIDGGTPTAPEYKLHAGVANGPAWNGYGASVNLTATAQNEAGTLGLKLHLRPNLQNLALTLGTDGGIYAWVKPVSFLTITTGRFNLDDYRGKVGPGDSWRPFGVGFGNEDQIFARFQNSQVGTHVKFALEQIPAFSLQFAVGNSGSLNDPTGAGPNPTGWTPPDPVASSYGEEARDVWANIQIGAGYTISDIAFIRAQFIGGKYAAKNTDDTTYKINPNAQSADYSQIQIGAQLLAIEGLNLDLGVNIPMKLKVNSDDIQIKTATLDQLIADEGGFVYGDSYNAPVRIALGATYTIGDFSLLGRLSTQFAEKVTIADYNGVGNDLVGKAGFNFSLGLQPAYKIGEIGIFGLDLGLSSTGNSKATATGLTIPANKDSHTEMSVGGFYKKPIAGGDFQIGVIAKFAAGGEAYSGTTAKETKKKAQTVIAVPIVFNYNF